jgi:hypothetical protein
MKKAMKSLVLVIPLVALMSAPAGANNSMVCAVQAIKPQKPLEGPPLSECQANGTNPTTRVTHWTSGSCEHSNTKENFCVRIDFLIGPKGKQVFPSDTIWIYTLVDEVVNGKKIKVCELTGSQAASKPDISVLDCDPRSTFLH